MAAGAIDAGGGQFKAQVKAIIEAERTPIRSLENRKKLEEAKYKLFQEFKGKFAGIDKTLEQFTSFKNFRELKADLGDGQNLIGVTLDKEKAEPGTWQLEIGALAERTAIMSNGFDSEDKPVLGIGFIIAEMQDGKVHEIYVDTEHSSLKGVANLINKQVNAPFHAAVVKDVSDSEKPYKLIVSAKKDGADDALYFPEFYFLDGKEDIYVDQDHEAMNAMIKLDGFAIEAESNQLKEFLPGVNLHLKQSRPDQPMTISITEDYQKIASKMKGLVDQLNAVLDFINKQNQIDQSTDTSSTFAGDTSLQTIEYRVRNLLHEGFPVGDPETEEFHFVFLNQLGLEFDKKGAISLKEDKFQKALEDDFEGIAESITGPYGFGAQTKSLISSYMRQGDGMLSVRDTGFRNRIKQIDESIASKERRVEQKATAVKNQFARLEANLNSMQAQQNYLSATLGSSGGGGANIISQLMG